VEEEAYFPAFKKKVWILIDIAKRYIMAANECKNCKK